MIDTHCHLTDKRFDSDREEVLLRAKEEGINKLICILSEFNSSEIQRFKELLQKNDIYGAAGIHPHDAVSFEQQKDVLFELLELDSIVALGEIGLDYHYMHSPREKQLEVFEKQMGIALNKRLPAVIHCREAFEDCADVLKKFRDVKTLLHCFSGDEKQLEYWLEQGYYISFAGPVTFKNADPLRECVKKVPLDRLLLETDSPYLAPQDRRGKRNEPAYVGYTYDKVAELRGMRKKDLADAIWGNARVFFGI